MKKINFENHRRFTTRFLRGDINPAALRLENKFRTLKSFSIMRKAEKQLISEHVRTINDTIEQCGYKRIHVWVIWLGSLMSKP